ncbi:TIGR04282 family arsenosugar biosynthesis glycosyltransferase [Frondihabitans australicus]|uniref:Glycosyltransferase A (GT-A) superfamily protein (DUF2064 family) n=1 Tax=Frondihabitans australicus TaxID=386892 RepID=A0A495IBL9_9MICO|nr:DUF2064 domain-containing protein [Frondihabitans australicus]RKR73319.1 hypothetical protein C8E83_0411 [Frondihabitans australicus]
MTAVVIVAKECLPGRVKTRLARTIGDQAAARVAAASLHDTMRLVRRLPASRRVLLYDGDVLPPDSDDFDVLPQVTGGLDERLAAMFDTMDEPTLLVGMDTPQLSTELLAPVFAARDDVDAWFGPAEDGGFWGLWLRRPDGAMLRGVPMSHPRTGEVQLERLRSNGLRVSILGTLRDVDEIDDATEVGRLAPDTRFAYVLDAELERLELLTPAGRL